MSRLDVRKVALEAVKGLSLIRLDSSSGQEVLHEATPATSAQTQGEDTESLTSVIQPILYVLAWLVLFRLLCERLQLTAVNPGKP